MAAVHSPPSAVDAPNSKIPFPSSSLRLQLKEDFSFNDTEQIAEKDRVYIAVLGASGSGKSTFINEASGSQLVINHELEPCEHPVELGNEFELDGRLITLIDTPGLDVNDGVNVNIMRGIFGALNVPMGIKLHGVIFLQSIFAELPWFAHRLFSLSRNLCIEKDLRGLVIAKTSWAEPEVTPQQIEARESQVDSFFRPAQIQNAKVIRCDFELNSRDAFIESTHELVRSVLEPLVDNQLANEKDVSGDESTVSPAQMRTFRAVPGMRGRGSRHHKDAQRQYFLFAQRQRTRHYANETARRRRGKDGSDIRSGIQRLFGERRDILARMGRLKARLRGLAT